ncbi:hypothetical protein DERP_012909 [Dermatophagoides pteronyssinus]|uniref:Uncharacterized protein n=1 Tax=Dermatophagoides pteronyssinus TaxID=6956 RepID=A0ABQ8J1Q0_DERPT|nr:hypothetical protein DERP_012909 [Dermatophagoides pteronyssinus]
MPRAGPEIQVHEPCWNIVICGQCDCHCIINRILPLVMRRNETVIEFSLIAIRFNTSIEIVKGRINNR